MPYNGGKQIQNPAVKNIFLQRQLEEKDKELAKMREEMAVLRRGKRKAVEELQTKERVVGKKGRKIGKLKALRGDTKQPESPVAILIGDNGTCGGKDPNIYGDRDIEYLEKQLREWLPKLNDNSEGPRVLPLVNQTKEAIKAMLLFFVQSPAFRNADFVFFACSIHGAESTYPNKSGQFSSIIVDNKGGITDRMLLQGSNDKAGIIDIIEYYSRPKALRCYLLGKCREPFKSLNIRLDTCFAFGDATLCQKYQKPGVYIGHPCGYHKVAWGADDNDEFSPWLQVFVNHMQQPGKKLVDALNQSETEVWRKSTNTSQAQAPQSFTNAFAFLDNDDDDDDGNSKQVIFKPFPTASVINSTTTTTTTTHSGAITNMLQAPDNNQFGGTAVATEEEAMDLVAAMDFDDFDGSVNNNDVPSSNIDKKKLLKKFEEGLNVIRLNLLLKLRQKQIDYVNQVGSWYSNNGDLNNH